MAEAPIQDQTSASLAGNDRAWSLVRIAGWLSGGTLVLGLLVFVYNARYARFWADDYCITDSVQARGFFGAQQNWYETWTGRYSYVLFTDLFTQLGPELVWLFVSLLVVAALLSVWWACVGAIEWLWGRKSTQAALLVALVLVFAYVSAMANRPESLYWVTGATNYTMPLIFLSLYGGVVTRRVSGTYDRLSWLAVTASFALTLVAAGFSEATMLWQNAVLLSAVVACVVLVRERDPRRSLLPILGAGLLGSLLGAIIVWLAPGNDVRQAQLGAHPELLEALRNGLRDGAHVTMMFLREPAVLMVGLLAAVLAFWLGPRPVSDTAPESLADIERSDEPAPKDAPARDILIALVLMQVVVTAVFASVFYFLRETPPDRSWVVAEVSLIAAVALIGIRLGTYPRNQAIQGASAKLATAATAIVSVVVAAIALGAVVDELDKRPELQARAAAWDQRDAEIRAARDAGERNIVTARLEHKTGLMDVTGSPVLWSNACIAAYYDVETIRSTR